MSDLLTTPFGFESTAADVIEGVDLTGKTAIVTGASSGIGVETARALACAGAAVTLTVRDKAAGDRVAGEIRDSTGYGRVEVGAVDLSDLSSVEAFVRAWTGPLDILVNNAGVMAVPELTMSASGHELQFATNHLGHFALAVGLHGALAAAGGARDRVGQFRRPPALPGRLRRHRLRVPRLRPVPRVRTVQDRQRAVRRRGDAAVGRRRHHIERADARGDFRHAPRAPRRCRSRRVGGGQLELKTVEQGAATSRTSRGSPLLDGVGGRYFEDCNEARVVDRRGAPGPAASPATRSTRPMPNGCGKFR